MTSFTKLKLAAVYQLCIEQDKSTEFTIQYLQDTCKVDLDCVLTFLNIPIKEKMKLYKEVNDFTDLMVKVMEM